mmetsp:Transcript_98750/g.247485  ORF Transcript_98750/g.247485 Transcript_98750/m.247485 type:complete len:202 (+) Transcript_98750:184-789(+)
MPNYQIGATGTSQKLVGLSHTRACARTEPQSAMLARVASGFLRGAALVARCAMAMASAIPTSTIARESGSPGQRCSKSIGLQTTTPRRALLQTFSSTIHGGLQALPLSSMHVVWLVEIGLRSSMLVHTRPQSLQSRVISVVGSSALGHRGRSGPKAPWRKLDGSRRRAMVVDISFDSALPMSCSQRNVSRGCPSNLQGTST